MLAMGLVCGVIMLAIYGAEKSWFLKILWPYLKGIKNRVCPLVHFESQRP